MIVSVISDGFGNQLFQYACGRMLAEKFQTSLRLEVGSFASNPLRKYELGHLNVEERFISAKQVARLTGDRGTPRSVLATLLNRRGASEPYTYLKQPDHHYFTGITAATANTVLRGYWQSEKYFRKAAPTIRREFTLKEGLQGPNKDLAAKMSHPSSVSVHFRRTDYLTVNYLSVCGIDYYQRAIAHIQARVSDPRLFVFADDLEWVRQHVDFGLPTTYVDNNRGDDSYKDLFLMSRCSHNIMANSTFSWWGAWLNDNPEKIVIGPDKWLGPTMYDRDVMPDAWVRL